MDSTPVLQLSVRVLELEPVNRGRMLAALARYGPPVRAFTLLSALLEDVRPGDRGCVVLGTESGRLPAADIVGLLRNAAPLLAAVAIVPPRDVRAAVAAMRAGAEDVLETWTTSAELATAVSVALEASRARVARGRG